MGETDIVQLEDTETHLNASKTIALIKEFNKQDKPWHISLNFQEPHLPCKPVRQFSDMYKPEDIPKWDSFNDEFKNKPYIQKQQLLNWGIENYTWEQWAPIVARYYGLITQTDDAIGRVLSFLDSIEQNENTTIIYTSDHGDMCGSREMMDKHYVLYDDVVKVPLIVSWPDKIKEGKIVDEFVVNCLDFVPTILDLVKIDTKECFHGKSFMPLLYDENLSDWRQEVVSTYNGQQFGLFTMRMIRNNKWKYIWNTTDIDELYDIVNDPYELNNLINDNSYMPVISNLRKKLYNQLIEHEDGLVMNPWLKAQLDNNRKLI